MAHFLPDQILQNISCAEYDGGNILAKTDFYVRKTFFQRWFAAEHYPLLIAFGIDIVKLLVTLI
jgi:hypothetical protein